VIHFTGANPPTLHGERSSPDMSGEMPKCLCLLRPCLVFLMVFFVGGPDSAMEWPDEPERIVSAFGSASNRHFRRGLEFKSEGQLISSWEAGEVIWTDDAQSRIPFRGIVAIEHRNGFRSVYLGIERLHNLERELENGQWLGYARGETWRFEIVDTERSRLVNPIFILPDRFEISLPDTASLEVLISGDSFAAIQDGTTLSAGLQTIVVSGVSPDKGSAAPAEISLYWIGQPIAEIRVDALRESENEIVLETPEPLRYESVFSPNRQIWFPDIRLDEGRGEIELRIEDEVGRVFIRSWSISVR